MYDCPSSSLTLNSPLHLTPMKYCGKHDGPRETHLENIKALKRNWEIFAFWLAEVR